MSKQESAPGVDQETLKSAFDLFQYRERIYFWFCLLGVLTFLPIAISDFIQHKYILGTVALVLFLMFSLNVISMRSGGPPKISIRISALTFFFMYPIAIHEMGLVGLLWVYTGIVFLALLLPARTGFVFNMWLLATITPVIFITLTLNEAIRSLITLSVVAILTRLFSGIVETEQGELRKAKEVAEQMAMTDPLTGLNNRRAFFDLGKKMIGQTHRYGHQLTLVMLDIDNFKLINDRHGHATGDAVIVSVADTLRLTLRESDIIGRLGGEEYGVLLPETTANVAVELAERLRNEIEMSVISVDEKDIAYTASFGVAQFDTADASLDTLLAKADGALYQAKERGRNQVVSGAT